jgi:hypothetical protein
MYLEHRSTSRMRQPRIHAVVATHTCPALLNPDPVPETELVFTYFAPHPDDPPF